MREARDEVRPPELGRVAPELARRGRHEALDHVGGLGPPRPAISVHRRGVGINGVDLAGDGRDVVLARQQRRVKIGGHRRREGGQVRAQVGDRLDAEADRAAGRVEREFGVGDVVAPVGVAQEGFAALGRPLDRAADLLGGPNAHGFLGVDEDLGAEAAADVRRDDAQLVFGRDADEGGQHEAGDVRVLARGVEREAFGALVVVAHRGARLHGVGDQAVVDEVELGHVGGAREGVVGRLAVAEVPAEHDVVGRDLVHGLAADASRRGGVHHGVEHLVVHRDLLRRVLGLRVGVGDHHGDVVADVADLALGQRRVRARLHGRAVHRMDHPAADQAAHLVGREVGAGVDRHDARFRFRLRGVDRQDAGVGVGRAQEARVSLAGAVHVVDVLSLAGDVALVFAAEHGGADAGCTHGFLRNGCGASRGRPCRRPGAAARGVRAARLIRPRWRGCRPEPPWLRRRPPPP